MFYKLFVILLIYHLQTPASGFPGLEDDLIFSGAGSGCNNGDDEDECPPLPESGSGDDDLITPVYVPPTRPPPTKKPKLKPDGEDKGKPCDDEDCFPGSGSGEVTEESTMKSTTDQTDVSITTDNLSAKPTTEEESNTASHTTGSTATNLTTSTFKTTERQDTTTDHQTTRVDTTVSTTSAEVHTYPTTSTTTTTERQIPPHVIIPAQENPYYKPIPSKRPERVSSETSEIVALIIGIIAGALIAVILIILVILKFKSRSDRSYKVEESKGYQQGPNAALLGNTSSTNGHHQAQYQLNGALRNGDKSAQAAQLKAKKRDSKDIKEWYV